MKNLNNNITDNMRKKEEKFFYFIIIDIMFLPYIFHLPIKLSMLALMLWMFREKRINKILLLNLMTFLFIGIISVCIGFLKGRVDAPIILTNIQTLVIIIYGYIVYEYVKDAKNKYDIDLTNIFIIFLVVASVFMIMYWINPGLFFKVRPIWTLQRTGEVFKSYASNRYTFFLSEPNNLAALVVAIMAYLNTVDKMGKKEMMVIAVITASIVISTSSNSGMLYYLVILFLCIILRKLTPKKTKKLTKNNFRKAFMYIATAAVLLFLVAIIINWDKVIDTSLFKTATNRYKLYINSEDADYSGARFDIWKSVIQNHNILEYILFGDASIGKPHNGHLYIIYAFGIVMYWVFMRIFFFDTKRNRTSVLVRLVFLAVFTMNTLVVDLRAFIIFAVLLAATSKEKVDYKMQG